MDFNDMYFTGDEHKNNFKILLDRYRTREILNDVQYVSSIYVAACPGIFEYINLSTLDIGASPLYNLTEWDDEKEMHIVSAAGLTGSTTRLVQVGLSVYNGYPIGLDDILGSVVSEDLFNVLLQAIKIRAGK